MKKRKQARLRPINQPLYDTEMGTADELMFFASSPAHARLAKAKKRQKELQDRIKQQKAHVKRLLTAVKKNTAKLKRTDKKLPDLEEKAKQEEFVEGMSKI